MILVPLNLSENKRKSTTHQQCNLKGIEKKSAVSSSKKEEPPCPKAASTVRNVASTDETQKQPSSTSSRNSLQTLYNAAYVHGNFRMLLLDVSRSNSEAAFAARLFERIKRKSVSMLLQVVLVSAMAGLLALALAKRKNLNFAAKWLRMQLRYNRMASWELLDDYLQCWNNKTELPSLSGRVAIVTGGSRGIGAEVVKMLLQCDMEVIIACRRPAAGEKAIQTIRESGVKTGKAKVMQLDNCSLESVKKFADEFKNNYRKLDILVNNAGVMFPDYGETKEGFEEQYGVNYLSHFLLTVLLIPLLKNAGTPEHHSRIVNVSSCAHLLGDIKFEDINHKRDFSTYEAYAQSKLAQLLFTKSLARLFEEKELPITSNAVHPGLVNTDLFENSYMKYFKLVAMILFKSPKQGAISIAFTAISPKIEKKSGLYISNCRDAPANPLTKDEAIQDRLFQLSLEQVGLKSVIV